MPATTVAPLDAQPVDLAQQWERITAWLRRNAPRTLEAIAPPADKEVIARAEAQSGVHWPPHLREFFQVQNGIRQDTWAQLLPQHDLLPVETIGALASAQRQIERDVADEFDDANRTASIAPAGTAAGIFSESFVPIAERDAYILFCDTRPAHSMDASPSTQGTESTRPAPHGSRSRRCWPTWQTHSKAALRSETAGMPGCTSRP
ncbi:hypothetical protein Rhow_001053 [Rhodococcus wratislaviensis]|uniref:Knr4/Smi1-like domain-containing protein n=1 Tax=Rhodococcus wratislaviensis TaxID=44752 RepID=A0A402CNB5_RHOWR|nr:hypothetical protein [Rhodococcus wratislaviensis]GCE45038.1 hypothetical protein Rhow_001053 [Rhodococcus wratislaviensis]